MAHKDTAATFGAADILELNAIGDAIFSEWYPRHRPGDPVPVLLPHHIELEARSIAIRHRKIANSRGILPPA